jgi:hypothetical protein
MRTRTCLILNKITMFEKNMTHLLQIKYMYNMQLLKDVKTKVWTFQVLNNENKMCAEKLPSTYKLF